MNRNSQSQAHGTTSKNVKDLWATMGYILHRLDQDISKITRLERLHLKIIE